MNFNFQRPRRLKVEELTSNYGKFVAEPLNGVMAVPSELLSGGYCFP